MLTWVMMQMGSASVRPLVRPSRKLQPGKGVRSKGPGGEANRVGSPKARPGDSACTNRARSVGMQEVKERLTGVSSAFPAIGNGRKCQTVALS